MAKQLYFYVHKYYYWTSEFCKLQFYFDGWPKTNHSTPAKLNNLSLENGLEIYFPLNAKTYIVKLCLYPKYYSNNNVAFVWVSTRKLGFRILYEPDFSSFFSKFCMQDIFLNFYTPPLWNIINYGKRVGKWKTPFLF